MRGWSTRYTDWSLVCIIQAFPSGVMKKKMRQKLKLLIWCFVCFWCVLQFRNEFIKETVVVHVLNTLVSALKRNRLQWQREQQMFPQNSWIASQDCSCPSCWCTFFSNSFSFHMTFLHTLCDYWEASFFSNTFSDLPSLWKILMTICCIFQVSTLIVLAIKKAGK